MKIYKSPQPEVKQHINLVLEKHIEEFGIRPANGGIGSADIETNKAMDLIGELCNSKDQKISSLRKGQIHSRKVNVLIFSPPEINDLV